jgi:DNA ligase-associated metallophosphoesterase
MEVMGEELILHPYKAVYWKAKKTLIVSDLHLGKIHHFRNAGIFVPRHASMDNYERLSSVLMEFEPRTVLLLGDLFHSKYNYDWKYFSDLRQTFGHMHFELVMGNHDILDQSLFEQNEVCLFEEKSDGPFIFTHHPKEDVMTYNIAGHIHPGVRLVGEGKQSLRLPCFYFGEKQAILPAFGAFTGTHLVYPQPNEQVVVISKDQLVEVTSLTD